MDVTCAEINVAITLMFIKVPFMAETIRPILRGLSPICRRTTKIVNTNEFEVFEGVVLPRVLPSILANFNLTFKEYLNRCNSIIFVTNGGPFRARVAPLVVVSRLRRCSCGDTATVTLMVLTASFLVLFLMGVIRREGTGVLGKKEWGMQEGGTFGNYGMRARERYAFVYVHGTHSSSYCNGLQNFRGQYENILTNYRQ